MSISNQHLVWDDEQIRQGRLSSVEEHGDEPDIERLVELAELAQEEIALDMITGLGHVARALARAVKHVDAVDPDAGMLAQAENISSQAGIDNISFIEGGPDKVPCESDHYDIVTARMALRHMKDGSSLVREAFRVLKKTGRFLLADSLAPPHPDLDAFLGDFMCLRDRSHVRSYSLAELEILFEREKFDINAVEIYPKEHDFESWSSKLNTNDAGRRMIEKMLSGASSRAKRHFRIIELNGRVVSFATWMILILAHPAQVIED